MPEEIVATTFPLNGITYDADDVGKYMSTRTSGVYSDDDFPISLDNADVKIGMGQAWMKIKALNGISVTLDIDEPVNIGLPTNETETCRIILRFNEATNKTILTFRESLDTAHDGLTLSKNSTMYELGLYDVRVHNGTPITLSDITDLRLDENYCGLMRDGVTRIPTETLMNNFTDTVTKIIADYEELDPDVADGLEGQIQRYKIQTGSYIGDGNSTKTLTFAGKPALVLITEARRGVDFSTTAFYLKGLTRQDYAYNNNAYCTFSVSGKNLTWTYTEARQGYSQVAPYNSDTKTYFYVAFCESSGDE